MRDINVVVIVGHLTRDSELKYTKTGMAIARFSVAVNRSRKQGEEWVDEVSFFDVDLWGKAAEGVNQYLIKGTQVGVEGELRQDRWDQDGQPRSKVVINAANVRLLGAKPQGQGSAARTPDRPERDQANPTNRQPAPSPATGPVIPAVDNFDDDIPF